MGLIFFGMLFLPPTMAFVKPSQVVVLVNRKSSESQELATYYMERRKIPSANRIDLDLPLSDSISRQMYEQSVLTPVREGFRQKGLVNQIKVLVTMYGVPLRVQAPKPTVEEDGWIADARGWKQSAMGLLREEEENVRKYQYAATQIPQTTGDRIFPMEKIAKDFSTSQMHIWQKQFITLLNERSQEMARQPEEGKLESWDASQKKIIRRVLGKVGVKAEHQPISRYEMAVQQMLAGLMHQPSQAKRTKAYAVVQEAYGLWGILAFAQWEIVRYGQKDASASLDSELSFLWWDPETYPLAGRLPNPFYLGYSGKVKDWPLPLLMVSRIDAPTVSHARDMIDQTLATESNSLKGSVYIDARGMKKGKPSSYGFYDADLQEFAKHFSRGSNYPVILENTEARLSQPGQAPDVALYVGWYRLRHYEDAFTFKPGAIGYHIASGEAVSIHNSKEQGWCKNALERGITVTLGPVSEPYLDAFPLPTEFFGLLYSGKYSLVEAYYLSTRYLSWKMVLFGDPLYRPWLKPVPGQAQVSKILLHNRSFPISPAERNFPSPNNANDPSKFPGKYISFDSRLLSQ